jgi:hypothetical protein
MTIMRSTATKKSKCPENQQESAGKKYIYIYIYILRETLSS